MEIKVFMCINYQEKLRQQRFLESLDSSYLKPKYKEKLFENLKYFGSKTKLYDKL